MIDRRRLLAATGAACASLAWTRSFAAAGRSSDFRFLAAGDLLGPSTDRIGMNDPDVQYLAGLIGKSDAAFANLEGNLFDPATFKGYASAENGGGYPLIDQQNGLLLRKLGVNLLSRANNHALDWGYDGLAATTAALDQLGFVHAGVGTSLTAARRPAILRTPKGTVALIACASSFTGMSPASDGVRGTAPRPGINPLSVSPVNLVTREEMDGLIRTAHRVGWQGQDLPRPDATQVRINNVLYRVADRTGMTYLVSDTDREAILKSVAEARSVADFVALSIHAHETLSGGYEDTAPADFMPSFFHDAIDAGADVIVRHGPHATKGLELYQGKPIFHGMGSMFFAMDRSVTMAGEGPKEAKLTIKLPDSWFETVLGVASYDGRKLKEVRFHPMMLKEGKGQTRGFPVPAQGKDAERILGALREQSVALGTPIRVIGGLGVYSPR